MAMLNTAFKRYATSTFVIAALSVALQVSRGQVKFQDPRHRQVSALNISLVSPDKAVERLSQLLKYRTVSDPALESHARHPDEFRLAHKHLQQSYPEVWQHFSVETVAQHSLLFKWTGLNAGLDPVLFVSHMDVVPATEGHHSDWTRGPFSGEVADNHIWGRGAMDLKFMLIALLEAAAHLIKSDWKPERTLYLAFGHDEEVGGDLGAGSIASLLKSRGVTLDMVIDEGGPILTDGLPKLLGTPVQIALVGTAEKGYTSIVANISGKGGHAMAPPTDQAHSVTASMAAVAQAVSRAPPPAELVAPVTHFMQALAPASPNPLIRYILHHCENRVWGKVLAYILTWSGASTAAVARTTVAMTRMNAGSADNVIPDTGSLMFNFRLLPGHSLVYAKSYLRHTIMANQLSATDPHPASETISQRRHRTAQSLPRTQLGRILGSIPGASLLRMLHKRSGVNVRLDNARGQKARVATPVSPPNSTQFALVAQAIYETVQPPQGIVVAPHLMTGASDSRHYLDMTANGVYRFFPLFMNLTAGDLNRVHGIDERIQVDDFLQAIKVYVRMMQLVCGKRA